MTKVQALTFLAQTVLRFRYPNSCKFNIVSAGVIKNVVDEVCDQLKLEVTGNDKVLAVTELKQRMIVRAA